MRSYPQPSFVAPPGSCQVVLVRHGQSIPYVDGDPFPLRDGHGDPPLSPRGRWQAERLADRLAAEPIAAIYVTPLCRTHQTAAPLAAQLGLEPREEPDLREVHLGEFEGGLFRKMSALDHPAVLEMRRTGDWGALPGGETSESLQRRSVKVIERLAGDHPDELIVVICHGGVVAALVGHAVGQGAGVYLGSRNGSVTHLVVGPDGWTVRSFNDASHIGSLTADHEPS